MTGGSSFLNDRGNEITDIRRVKAYDEITLFWCIRFENTPDQNGRYR